MRRRRNGTHTQTPTDNWQTFWLSLGKPVYTPVFNSNLEQAMYAPQASPEQRCEAAIIRYSWGHHSSYAVIEPGESDPMTQQELADRLQLKKQAVSRALARLRNAGRIQITRDPKQPGKRLSPAMAPEAGRKAPEAAAAPAPPPAPPPGTSFEAFKQWAAESHAELLAEMEAADRAAAEAADRRRAIRATVMGIYKAWKQTAQPDKKSDTVTTFETQTGATKSRIQERLSDARIISGVKTVKQHVSSSVDVIGNGHREERETDGRTDEVIRSKEPESKGTQAARKAWITMRHQQGTHLHSDDCDHCRKERKIEALWEPVSERLTLYVLTDHGGVYRALERIIEAAPDVTAADVIAAIDATAAKAKEATHPSQYIATCSANLLASGFRAAAPPAPPAPYVRQPAFSYADARAWYRDPLRKDKQYLLDEYPELANEPEPTKEEQLQTVREKIEAARAGLRLTKWEDESTRYRLRTEIETLTAWITSHE